MRKGCEALQRSGLGAAGGGLEKRFHLIIPDLPGSGFSPPPRRGYTIGGFAKSLWSLLDHLGARHANIVGFSLGGAVALEMAALRPSRVQRPGLINSVATYRPDDWHKWIEARITAFLVRFLGMPRTASLMAARLFPESWQQAMRKHAAEAVGAVPASCYLGMGLALTS
jgi:pimeloyl-ACP methyl ester carboxylesterase